MACDFASMAYCAGSNGSRGGISRLKIWRRPLKQPLCLLIFLLTAGIPGVSLAQTLDRGKLVAAREVLNDEQLDSVTAASTGLNLDLSASALGPTATTATEGSARNARTTILLVAIDQQAPASGRVRLLGASPADLLFAAGRAEAKGASDAHCSASIDLVGSLAFFAQSNTTTTTAGSAICSCAGFGIGLVAH